MRIASVTVAYKEPRFIVPHLRHHKDFVDEQLVLVSSTPWHGTDSGEKDTTAELARKEGATVIEFPWANEHEQRNAGQEFFFDYDWLLILDPDEFLTKEDFRKLREFLQAVASMDAYVTDTQLTYWKSGMRIDPPEDYKQIIAVRPSVRFYDKRCVTSAWSIAPVHLHHFAYARTDAEMLKKISHFSHAPEFNTTDWYEEVWKSQRTWDLHPLHPHDYAEAVETVLPTELEELNLWPSN